MNLKGHLARGYSESALSYDATAGPLYLAGLRRLLPLVRVAPHPAVLDVGCGTGINLLELARVLGPCRLLVGVDLSPGMVAVAGAKAAAAGVPAHIMVADAEALPFADQTFDLLVANSVFHWIADRARAMAELTRLLRPGGQLVLTCAAEPGFREWTGVVQGVVQSVLGPGTPPPLPVLPTPEELAGLVLSAGLMPEFFNHLVYPVRVHDPAGFTVLMATVAPHWLADLTPGQRQAALQAVAAQIAAAGPGGFTCTWGALELVARRPGPAGAGWNTPAAGPAMTLPALPQGVPAPPPLL